MISETPQWLLTTVGPLGNRRAALVIEPGSPTSHAALRTGFAGTITLISPAGWKAGGWPRCGQLFLETTATTVEGFRTRLRTVRAPAALESSAQWQSLVVEHGEALLVLAPPRSLRGLRAGSARAPAGDEVVRAVLDSIVTTSGVLGGLAQLNHSTAPGV